jgi:ribosomal protein L37AE/L43A
MAKACPICECTSYKTLSNEEYSTIIKCEECGAEYAKVTATHNKKIRKNVEKKIEKGEVDFQK